MRLRVLESVDGKFFVDGNEVSIDDYIEAKVQVSRSWLIERVTNYDEERSRLTFDLDRPSPVPHFSDPYDFL